MAVLRGAGCAGGLVLATTGVVPERPTAGSLSYITSPSDHLPRHDDILLVHDVLMMIQLS